MNMKPIIYSLALISLSACSAQTVHDLIPQHQLTLLQAEAYVKPEGGFLLKPDLATATTVSMPVLEESSQSWPQQLPMQTKIPDESEAVSVSSMLQQALEYAESQKKGGAK